MSLYDLEPGRAARVVRVDARGSIRQRLLDLGLLPDTEIQMVRVAPTGHPVWIRLEGSQLALRRDEARSITIEPC